MHITWNTCARVAAVTVRALKGLPQGPCNKLPSGKVSYLEGNGPIKTLIEAERVCYSSLTDQ